MRVFRGEQVVRGQELGVSELLWQFLTSANCSFRRNSQRLGKGLHKFYISASPFL